MNPFTEIYAPIIGRILMGGFFLWEGIEKALNFASTVDLLLSNGVPAPLFMAVAVIAIEAIGGIALVAGYKSRTTALWLALFMVPASLLYANFQNEVGVSLFLQSMAITGGLLYVSAFGSGSWDPGFPYRSKSK